jgi:hypothetical protein
MKWLQFEKEFKVIVLVDILAHILIVFLCGWTIGRLTDKVVAPALIPIALLCGFLGTNEAILYGREFEKNEEAEEQC